jgi:hypothetical protein
MDKLTFAVFEPDHKFFRWTPNWIVVISYVLVIIMSWLLQGTSPVSTFNTIRDWLLVLTTGVSIYFIIASFWTYEPLEGKIEGEIEFEKDHIRVNDEVYELVEVSNIDFRFNNFYGESLKRFYKSANGILSQGVNNSVIFTDKEGQTHQVYFRLDAKNEYQSFSPFINEAVRLKKMQFKQAIDAVGIENVSITY